VRRIATLVGGGLVLAAAGGALGAMTQHAIAATPPLVYACPGDATGTPPPCVNNQELAVTDRNGAPIFAVGETGGAHAYGDNLGVNGTSVFTPNTTLSWESPVAYYGTTACTVPAKGAVWIDSAGGAEFWVCAPSSPGSPGGTWVKHAL